jgi:hypothetical protein
MNEKQPILRALIEQGWMIPGQTMGIVISEKLQTGTVLINSKVQEPYRLYWHKDTKLWTDKKPEVMVNPGIIERHYASAI